MSERLLDVSDLVQEFTVRDRGGEVARISKPFDESLRRIVNLVGIGFVIAAMFQQLRRAPGVRGRLDRVLRSGRQACTSRLIRPLIEVLALVTP